MHDLMGPNCPIVLKKNFWGKLTSVTFLFILLYIIYLVIYLIIYYIILYITYCIPIAFHHAKIFKKTSMSVHEIQYWIILAYCLKRGVLEKITTETTVPIPVYWYESPWGYKSGWTIVDLFFEYMCLNKYVWILLQ